MTAARGQGRPALFDTPAQDTYLKARTAGATQEEAAALAGVAVRTVRDAYTRTTGFRTADKEAAALGRKTRLDDRPHDESRYTNQGCRCPTCTRAASAARTQRATRAARKEESPTVSKINTPAAGSPQNFLLARAS